MRLALAGVSHHRAPLEVRERVAVDLAAAGELAHELAAAGGPAHEAVVLSTCNRTEVYVAGDAPWIYFTGRVQGAPAVFRCSPGL